MNLKKQRNLKAIQWEFDDSNSDKVGTDDWEDDFTELAQEINKEK